MRTAILGFATMAIIAVAQPASAIDDGFRGWYRVTQTDNGPAPFTLGRIGLGSATSMSGSATTVGQAAIRSGISST
jgi:hypothetical protein